MTNLKGKKMWGVASQPDSAPRYLSKKEDEAIEKIDNEYCYLIEVTVTKVYKVEKELKEVE